MCILQYINEVNKRINSENESFPKPRNNLDKHRMLPRNYKESYSPATDCEKRKQLFFVVHVLLPIKVGPNRRHGTE